MSNTFDDIILEWDDKEYVIKANRVMGAIARIEDSLTYAELQQFAERGGAPIARLAMAYGSVLRYAGLQITDDEVYQKAFETVSNQKAMMQAVMSIMKLMLPKSVRDDIEKEIEAGGQTAPPKDTEGKS